MIKVNVKTEWYVAYGTNRYPERWPADPVDNEFTLLPPSVVTILDFNPHWYPDGGGSAHIEFAVPDVRGGAHKKHAVVTGHQLMDYTDWCGVFPTV
jgi:hypothetical protein